MPAQEIDGSVVTHYIGIDPGVGGGIAYTSPLGDRVMAMPETLHETRLALNNILDMQQDGRTPTDEDFARCWNGGPMGYKKKETIK